MNNLITLLEKLYSQNFQMKETEEDTVWSQTERNKVRADIIDAIIKDLETSFKDSKLADEGLEVRRTCDGASINVPNKEWGSFIFSLSPKMHNLNYDLDEEANEYNRKQEKKKKADA